MKLVVCLGNPGRKYRKNRHNVGMTVGDHLAKKYDIRVKKKQHSSITGEGNIEGYRVALYYPQTYMNRSGIAVNQAMQHYRVSHDDLVVLHDEIELPFGEVRDKFGGGHKGQNGLRSIIQETGSADFFRIRIGVGRPDNPHMTVADWVLSNFTGEELKMMDQVAETAIDLLASCLRA